MVLGMNLNDWLQNVTRGATAQEMALRADIPKRTVQSQIASGNMSAENIVRIAAAYSYHPLRALIDWSVVDESWAMRPDVKLALRLASEDDLADEILGRLSQLPNGGALTQPIDKLAQRRSNIADGRVGQGSYDGTVKEFDWSQPHAADSSADEQAEREKRGEEPID